MLQEAHGPDRVRGVARRRHERGLGASALFEAAAREFGGLDILVSNAGIASASPIDETSLATWQRNVDILATGYFLVARDGFRADETAGPRRVDRVRGQQERAGRRRRARRRTAPPRRRRCTSRAASPSKAREHGIRVNVVNPDAVIRGSRIWSGTWRTERAASNRIDEDEVEEFYRQRSLLKRSVLPEDVAEAVAFFASDASAKSTGNILNVDAGNATAFTR